MRYAKLLFLNLVAFTLFGCNQPRQSSEIINPVEAVNTPQEENSVPQQVAKDENPSPQQVTSKVNPSPQKNAQNKPSIKSSSQSGIIDETSYNTALKSLNSIAKGCQESKETEGNLVKSICKKDGEIVKASNYHAEFGDGIGYWFSEGRVVAAQRFHNGETFIFNRNGTLSSKFAENEKITNLSSEQIKDAQNLINGYKDIIAAFNNNQSRTKASSSKRVTEEELRKKIGNGRIIGSASCDGDGLENDVRVDYDGDGMPDECVTANFEPDSITPEKSLKSKIIDETSFQTVSKSLANITKGCTKSKKTEDNLEFEICKKGDRVVSASEYASEADAGSVYWFSPDGKLVAMRYFGSGDTYVFDSNYKVSSKFNVYKSNKVNKIAADERKRIEEDSYFAYRRIFDVFGI